MATAKASLHGLTRAKADRLKAIYDEWEQFPGRAVHGSGLTGLNPNDAQGYSAMLNEQTEALNLENEMNGEAPVRVREGGVIPSQTHGIASDPTSSFNTSTGPYGAFGVGTGGQSASMLPATKLAALSTAQKPPLQESHEAFMARLAKQYGAR